MQSFFPAVVLVAVVATSLPIRAQEAAPGTPRRFFVGSTLFVLSNLIPQANAPDFGQLNLGFRPNARNSVSLELKTWKYAWSLGIPYGAAFEAPEEKFPGYIREYGVAAVYQHFWWRGFYTGLHVMGARQRFNTPEGNKISTGFQVFNTYHVGYQAKFAGGVLFLEPSLAVTHRAYHTKIPESFRRLDDKRSKFFVGEPGLHFGLNF